MPPPSQTPQYLTILMTEREGGGASLSFYRILAPPNAPHDSKILYYLNDTDEDAIIFVGFWRPPMPPRPSDATILNYLTDREGGGRALPFVEFWRPLPDASILNYPNDGRGGGAIIFCRILAPPPPSPDATILNDLNAGEGGGGQYPVRSYIYKNIVTVLFVGKIHIPPCEVVVGGGAKI